MNEDGVERLIQALEQQTGTRWSSLVSERSVGRSKRYQELYAFIWREDVVSYAGGAVIYLDPEDWFAREPFAARFRTDNGRHRWTAATVHVIYGKKKAEREAEARQLKEYVRWLEENVAEGDPVLLMGDFNLSPNSSGFKTLNAALDPVIRKGATTLSTKEGQYANLYDNIWHRPGKFVVREAWIDRFPERLGINYKEARRMVSDHAPAVIRLDEN